VDGNLMLAGHDVLATGGEMGALMRAHDWAATPVGPPAAWTQALRTAVRLLLTSRHPMFIFWGETHTCFYNDAYRLTMGPERHPGALGQPGRQVWGEIWPIIGPQIEQVMAGGEATWHEDQLVPVTRHGRRQDVWWTYGHSPIDDSAAPGGIGGVLVVCNDVTSEHLGRNNLREVEARLRELNRTLEQQVEQRIRERDRTWRLSQDLLVVADTDGTLLAVNAAWTELLGWDSQDLIGIRFVAFTHSDDLDATLAAFAGIFEAPLTRPYEYRLRHKDETYRWFAWTGAFEDGRIYANGRHTTSEREQALALVAAEEQLRQSQKMEAVGQLTGGLAHDFNNLLAGISGSLELLQTRVAQGRINDLDRYLVAAQGASKRAAALTHRLLAFTRRQTLDPKPTDVNRLMAGMEELIRRTVGPAVAIEVVGAAGLWPVLVDPNQLENALLNLCINARDALPNGGRLTIETANRWLDDRTARQRDLPAGQYVSLCVSDTGTGMTPEVIRRAFDPFFTTKPIGMGTGLGLSMIYGFVQQSGGQARIYSELGQGAMICLYLPRHHGAVEAAEEQGKLAAAPHTGQGKTVLVVDDEPTVRMLVTEVLEDLGYTAIEAADGSAGMQVLRSDVRIDLLVTDVGLPGGMNGRQVADAGRVVRPDLKVLFITGYAENAVLSHGHLDHGMHVLTKPFAMKALAGQIRALIADGRGG